MPIDPLRPDVPIVDAQGRPTLAFLQQWEKLRGLVQALEYGGGTHTIEDVIRQIELGEAQLWEGDRAVMVTEIHQTPRARVLHVWLAAGDLEEVIQLSRLALEWGRAQAGCTRATLAGRRGWERVLKREGWQHELVVLGRDL